MNLFKKIIANCRQPRSDFWGRLVLKGMNIGHNRLALWCINKCIQPIGTEDVLDIGCGGGRNIAHFLRKTEGTVCGIDYSAESVAKSLEKNTSAVLSGRTRVLEATVSSIPFEDDSFDLATAFETIYFWPNLAEDFKEVWRVIRPGGRFVVCCEISSEAGNELWLSLLDMKIYTPDEIVESMRQGGFSQCSVFESGKSICVIGYK